MRVVGAGACEASLAQAEEHGVEAEVERCLDLGLAEGVVLDEAVVQRFADPIGVLDGPEVEERVADGRPEVVVGLGGVRFEAVGEEVDDRGPVGFAGDDLEHERVGGLPAQVAGGGAIGDERAQAVAAAVGGVEEREVVVFGEVGAEDEVEVVFVEPGEFEEQVVGLRGRGGG